VGNDPDIVTSFAQHKNLKGRSSNFNRCHSSPLFRVTWRASELARTVLVVGLFEASNQPDIPSLLVPALRNQGRHQNRLENNGAIDKGVSLIDPSRAWGEARPRPSHPDFPLRLLVIILRSLLLLSAQYDICVLFGGRAHWPSCPLVRLVGKSCYQVRRLTEDCSPMCPFRGYAAH
jgi:hypothetical protein